MPNSIFRADNDPKTQPGSHKCRRQIVEKETGLRTCVIYGALPPEMRRLQARLFNERDSEYSVLVASDAVGMGLNLNIRRVIFHTLEKYDGESLTLEKHFEATFLIDFGVCAMLLP